MSDLRWLRDEHDYGGGKLQYRINQPVVDIGGHLCPGDWTEWRDVPIVFIGNSQESSDE